MKALVTGATGFVGQYLQAYLEDKGIEVFGTHSNENGTHKLLAFTNTTDEQIVIKYLNEIKPDYIYHLAGFSNVKLSWEQKHDVFEINTQLTIKLLEAIRKSDIASSVKVLTVGSSEEYGLTYPLDKPINELNILNPMNPYGASKASISFLTKQYFNAYGMKIIHARPFNHIGPNQRTGFVVPDFASQVVQIMQKRTPATIKVGNLDSMRDFTDVRDIVQAYVLLLESNEYGEIFNICSGKPIRIGFLLEELIRISNIDIKVEVDLEKKRPIDIPIYIGDNSKLRRAVGWTPQVSLEQTLVDVLDYLSNSEEN